MHPYLAPDRKGPLELQGSIHEASTERSAGAEEFTTRPEPERIEKLGREWIPDAIDGDAASFVQDVERVTIVETPLRYLAP